MAEQMIEQEMIEQVVDAQVSVNTVPSLNEQVSENTVSMTEQVVDVQVSADSVSSMTEDEITELYQSAVVSGETNEKEKLCEYLTWKLEKSLTKYGISLVSVEFKSSIIIKIKNNSNENERAISMTIKSSERNIRDTAEKLFSYTFSLLHLILSNNLLHKNITEWAIKMDNDKITDVFIVYKKIKLTLTQAKFFTQTCEFDQDKIFIALIQICRSNNKTKFVDSITFEPIPKNDAIVHIKDEPEYLYGRRSITQWHNHNPTSPFTRSRFRLEELVLVTKPELVPFNDLPNLLDLPSNRIYNNSLGHLSMNDEYTPMGRQCSDSGGIDSFETLANVNRISTL